MAYRQETIKAIMTKAKVIRKDYESMSDFTYKVPVCISNGNRKIGRVMNVSTMPIMACGNCKECSGYCYDIKACVQYKNVLDARVRNLVYATKYRKEYFDYIDNRISRRRTNKYFRWHVAGDILDCDYFSRMVEIANRHPDFVFWTYTKMYHIVNEYVRINGTGAIPDNFHIMFSKWDGLKMDNPYNFPVFACRLKDGNKDYIPFNEYFKCAGNCDICKANNSGCIKGENTFADEH